MNTDITSKLKVYKVTKPELFGPSFQDLTQTKQTKPWHKYDVTDFFNYGFNEHTLQIYIHKVTQLSQAYREQRKQYVEKCLSSEGTIFEKAQQLQKLAKEYLPMDLGGVYVEVDTKVNVPPIQVEQFYEVNINDKLSFAEQFRCSGEQMIYRSSTLEKVQSAYRERILEISKQHKNIYMFDQAIKVFPEQERRPRSRTPKKMKKQ